MAGGRWVRAGAAPGSWPALPLPGEDAFAFQQLHQRRGLPHVGDGQRVEGHEGVGVKVIRSKRYLNCYLQAS